MKDEWKQHTPGACPVPPNQIVQVRMENGDMLVPLEASEIDWNCPGDQVAFYRLVNVARLVDRAQSNPLVINPMTGRLEE